MRPGTAPKQQIPPSGLQKQGTANGGWMQAPTENNRPLSPYSKIYSNRNQVQYP